MKKIIFGFTATVLLMCNSNAQTNNPNNQLGVDIVATARVIYKDYVEGKIENINQEVLDHYFKTLLPNYPSAKLDDFNNILSSLKSANNASIIKGSGYSEQGKAFLQKSLESYSITKLVDEVKSSKINKKEKDDILTVLAINYNLIKPFFDEKPSQTTKGCFDLDVFNSYPIALMNKSEGINSFIFGGLGYVLGTAFCVPCGIVGGAIGLVFGGWADDKGIRPTIYSGPGSSGPGSGTGWSPQP